MSKVKEAMAVAKKAKEAETKEKLVNISVMVPPSHRTHWQIQAKLNGYKSLKSAIVEFLNEKFGEPSK